MLEALAEVFVQAAEPRSAHAPVHAVKSARLSWVNKLAAGLGHGRSVGARALRKNRIGCNLGSDLSEGCLRSATNRSVLDQKRSNDDEKPNRTNLIAARTLCEHCASRNGRLWAPFCCVTRGCAQNLMRHLKNSENSAKTVAERFGSIYVHAGSPRRFVHAGSTKAI